MEETTTIKSHWQQLFIKNKFDVLFKALLEHSRELAASDWEEEILLQQSRYNRWKQREHAGALSYEKVAQERVQIAQALLHIIREIPMSRLAGKLNPKKTIASLQERSLRLLLVSKAIAILAIVFQQSTGGFSMLQSAALVIMLLPVLVWYIALHSTHARQAILPHLRIAKPKQIRINRIAFLSYTLAWLCLLPLQPQGQLGEQEGFTILLILLLTVESGLSYYLGQLVIFISRKP